MKKTILILASTLFCASLYAQGEKKENRVRIVTIENGQKKVIEKIISDDKDLGEEFKILEDSIQTKDGKKKIITVDVRKGSDKVMRRTRETIEGPEKELRVFKFKGSDGGEEVIHVVPDMPEAPMAPGRPMDIEIRKINGNAPGFKGMLREQMSETIHGLHIEPNAPFNGKFNIHFNAPEKGTVSIAVTDLNGKELAVEQIKDFQGDYLGQIDVKKSAKGVYFIRVTQGNDGAVRRVKVD